MNMIGGAANIQRNTTLPANDTAEVRVNPFADVGRDRRKAVFRAEHEMVMKADMC
jgi:hypothetical protein